MREKKEVIRDLEAAKRNLAEVTGREGATADEIRAAREKLEGLTDELNTINVTEAADKAAAAARAEQTPELKNIAQRFSISKFIREIAEKSLTGVEAEVAQMGAEEAKRCNFKLEGVGIPASVLNARMSKRAFAGNNVTTEDDGGYLVAEELQYQEALRAKLVLSGMGARYIGGLTDNITLIEGSPVSVSWENENDEVADTKKAFTTRQASPKRVAISVPISKQLAIQSSFDIDQIILNDIYGAHAQAIEEAAINGGGTKEPVGLLNTEGIGNIALGENGLKPTFASIVALETAISLKNADMGALAYLTNPKVRGLLKTTLKANGVPGFIWDNNELNGYPARVSNLVPSNLTKGSASSKCSAIIFGDWSQLWIMQWGGLDLIVDPYTLKKQGAYEITLNARHDIHVRRKESFAAIKDALTE